MAISRLKLPGPLKPRGSEPLGEVPPAAKSELRYTSNVTGLRFSRTPSSHRADRLARGGTLLKRIDRDNTSAAIMTSPIHAAYCNAAFLFRLEEFRDFCLALELPHFWLSS